MKLKKFLVGLMVGAFIVGGISTLGILRNTEVTNAADGDAFAQIRFTTDDAYVFEDGSKVKDYTTDKEAIETLSLPMFQKNDAHSFVGWRLTELSLAAQTETKHQKTRGQNPDSDSYDLEIGTVYQPHELLRIGFYHGDEATFEAVYAAQGSVGSSDIWEQDYGNSVSDRVPSVASQGVTAGNITVLRYASGAYTEISSRGVSADNFRAALFDIYVDNQPVADYVIAIASNSTIGMTGSTYSSIGNKTETATSASDVSFYSLKNRANSITITGAPNDPVDDTLAKSAPANTALLNFNTTTANGLNFGTNVEFRNIRYNTPFLAANGNSLTLGGNSWGTSGTTVYGGSYSGDVTASLGASITVSSTGSGTWNIFGGSETGTFTGSTNLVINNYSNAISTLSGGNKSGVVTGDTHLSLYNGSEVISNLYGGTVSGTVNGNVYNKMRSTSASSSGTSSANKLTVNNFYGGSDSGSVLGNVENLVAGYGRLPTEFVGGSKTGNIGLKDQKNYINNIYDSSLFGTADNPVSGGNRESGYIYAAIFNTVRAGLTTASGSIDGFNGSAGDNSNRLAINESGLDAFDVTDKEGRKNYAFNAAVNSSTGKATAVITVGDIDSHLLGGGFSSGGEAGYAHATGVKGYYEGNSFMEIGILNGDDTTAGGYNFCSSVEGVRVKDLTYQVGSRVGAPSTMRTYTGQDWDVFGGAGRAASSRYSSYIYGDAGIVQNNTLARWTYGGGYYGGIDGNTSNTVYGGLVDTLEGGGYATDRIWGNTTANFHNGEVNFFFSGGGWDDSKIYGNATAYATGGIVNCAIGGTYGSSGGHTINGDSNVYVTGGNFSGYPSHGTRGFSGGPTNAGRITGNVSLTLDLRGTTGFQLPTGVNISGGQNTAGSGRVGTDSTNSIELNIYTDSGSDVLNGAIIYGDAGTASRTESGHITMNIDAPDSTIGSLYATSYSNIERGSLLRDVDINVLRAGRVGALSGAGNVTGDDVTNAIYSSSLLDSKAIDVHLGTELAENPFTGYAVKADDILEEDKEINFGVSGNTTGLINFTSLTIENGFTALANSGSIKNGRNATATNHYNQYDKFGDVTIENNSGLGVTSASSFISLGKLTVLGEGSIYSPSGTGKINLSSISMANEEDRLTWRMQSGGTSTVNSTGTYFGSASAYQVLTFSSTDSGGQRVTGMADDITPLNFMGIDETSGKTFVGDSDMTTGANASANLHKEYGIMIPGSVIDFNVSGDYDPDDLNNLLSAGTGLISHDVTDAQTDLNNPPMIAYATVGAKTGVKTGRLIIPITSAKIYPTLTFDPDDPTGSWLRSGSIVSTKVDGSFDEIIAEQMNTDSVSWKMGNNEPSKAEANEYSYTIDIVFSNELELTGRNIIVTESEAKALTNDALVQEAQNVFGRPFLTTSLSGSDLDSLAAGLDEGTFKKVIPITYHIQDFEEVSGVVNEDEQTWNIVIVPDGSVISDELDFALYANNAEMLLTEAAAVTDQSDVDTVTNARVIYADGSPDGVPNLDESYIEAIREADPSATIPITYTATHTGEFSERTLNNSVSVTVLGHSVLTIEFVNEGGTVLSGYTLTAGEETTNDIVTNLYVGDVVNLKSKTYELIQQQLDALELAGYEITTRPTDEEALSITDVTQTVQYIVTGQVFLESSPTTLDFGSIDYTAETQRINDPSKVGDDLVVADTRADISTGWTLQVAITEDMKNSVTGSIMTEALLYVRGDNDEFTLNSGNQNAYISKTGGRLNVTGTWGPEANDLGLKLEVNPANVSGSQLGTFSGIVTWTIIPGQP
ncbi:beta strand repeat-containing protein [Enterococcus sp. LJL90]